MGGNDKIIAFCERLHNDKAFLTKHSVKIIYGFFAVDEIWVITDNFNTNAIIGFGADIYLILEEMQADFTPMLIGTHEISPENIPPYDLKIEIN